MTKRLETKLEITSWDERPYQDLDEGRKFTRAEISLAGTGDGLESASTQMLMYYRGDGTSSYVSLMHVVGSLDGRAGAFVLRGDGTFDGKTARGESTVVDATGDLAGLTGTAESASTHDDYPFMPLSLKYDLE